MIEWREDKIGNLATTFAGGTPSRSREEYFKNGTIPWISSSEVNQEYITATHEHITQIAFENSSAKWIPKNSVLIALYGATAGQVAKLLINATSNQAVLAIIPNSGVLDSDFLNYQVRQHKDSILFLAQGSGQPNLSKNLVDNFRICYPSIEKQRKIAKILGTIDAVIEKTQAAIAKYKSIKQGMLHDLFTRGIDVQTGKLRPKYQDAPELYKESKLGKVPKDWKVATLDELTDKIGSGVTPTGGSEVYKSSGVLFIRSQNVLIGNLSIEDAAFITPEVDEKMEGSRVKENDVLLNITGASIGRCAYFPEDLIAANVNQHVCIIRFNNTSKALAIFASEFMNSHFGQHQINRSNAGGNREGLNFQQIKSFSFPKIDQTEIQAISDRIDGIGKKLTIEKRYLGKITHLKAGLMSDLLSGKKDVK